MPSVYLDDDELIEMILDRPEIIQKVFDRMRKELEEKGEDNSFAWQQISKLRAEVKQLKEEAKL